MPPMEQRSFTRRRFLQTSAAGLAATSLARSADDGFTPLFDGKSLAGWEGDPLLWVVEDGVLIGTTRQARAERYS